MTSVLKITFIVLFFLLSIPAQAWTTDYVSAFKPVKKNRSLSELQRDIKKDIFQIRSMVNFQGKKIIDVVKDRKNTKNTRFPANI